MMLEVATLDYAPMPGSKLTINALVDAMLNIYPLGEIFTETSYRSKENIVVPPDAIISKNEWSEAYGKCLDPDKVLSANLSPNSQGVLMIVTKYPLVRENRGWHIAGLAWDDKKSAIVSTYLSRGTVKHMAHEIGHVLGLKHHDEDDSYCIMFQLMDSADVFCSECTRKLELESWKSWWNDVSKHLYY